MTTTKASRNPFRDPLSGFLAPLIAERSSTSTSPTNTSSPFATPEIRSSTSQAENGPPMPPTSPRMQYAPPPGPPPPSSSSNAPSLSLRTPTPPPASHASPSTPQRQRPPSPMHESDSLGLNDELPPAYTPSANAATNNMYHPSLPHYAPHPASHGHQQQHHHPPPQASTPQWGAATDTWSQQYPQSYASQPPLVEPPAPQYASTSSRQAEPPPSTSSPFEQRGSYQYSYAQASHNQLPHGQPAPQPASYNDTHSRRTDDRHLNIPPPISSNSSSSLSANLPPAPPAPSLRILRSRPLLLLRIITTLIRIPRHCITLNPFLTKARVIRGSRRKVRRHLLRKHLRRLPSYNPLVNSSRKVKYRPSTTMDRPAPVSQSPYAPYPSTEPSNSVDYNSPAEYGRQDEQARASEYKPTFAEPAYNKGLKRVVKESPAPTPMPPPPPPLPSNPAGLDFLKLVESYRGVLEACEKLNQSAAPTAFGNGAKVPDDALERMLQHASYGAQMLEAAAAALSPQPPQSQQHQASYPQSAMARPPSGNDVRNHASQSQSPMNQPPHTSGNGPSVPQQNLQNAPSHAAVTPTPGQEQGNTGNSGNATNRSAMDGSGSAQQKKKDPAATGAVTMELTIHQHNPDGSTTTISGKPPAKEARKEAAKETSQTKGNGGSHKKQKHDADGDGQKCLGCGATSTPEWRRGPLGPRTLCNACGLVYAKLIKKRVKETTGSSGSGSSGRQKAPNNNIPGVPNVNGVSTSVMSLGTMQPPHRDGSGDGDSDYGGRT
ncbi:hypothetical protein NMY22_g4245 [Coprinellus aureogranulatus]|nr:hypothetical protein NMY22_g4245 [Coprinellus aureogranulatus]